MTLRPARLLCFSLAFALVACGGDEPPPEQAADAGVVAEEQASAPAANEAPASASVAQDEPANDRALEVADLDRYARGVAWEIEKLAPHVDAVKQAREKKDDAAETAALFALASPLDAEAAATLGVPPGRYSHVRNTIDGVLGALQMSAAMKPQLEAMEQIDTSGMTDEQKAQQQRGIEEMKAAWGDPYAKLPPDVAAAMKAREVELARLRDQLLALRLSVL